jgi:hypothetical protein
MPDAVYTRIKRFQWVKGWTGVDPADGSVACGDGTEYPLKVTLDELAEIWYRVRDARFRSGLAHSVDLGFAVYNFSFTEPDPDVDFFKTETFDLGGADEHTVLVERSYTMDSPPVNVSDERDIWTEALNVPTYPTLGTLTAINGAAHCAQLTTVIGGITNIPTVYSPYADIGGAAPYYAAEIELAFNGYVAIVNVAADGNFNPANPTNELYIGMQFRSFSIDSGVGLADIYAVSVDNGMDAILPIELSIVLANSTPTVALYGRSAVTHSGDGYFLDAVEWFPYLDGDGPVWDATTGELVPDDALPLDLGDAEAAGIFLLHF